jgi:hypothetical protein
MPFDDYTLDPYSGGVTFRDSGTGEELLTTPEAGMARMQEIDAQRAALMPGYVPETTGVAYSTELPPYVANVAPALPPKPSLFDEGSMALAEAPAQSGGGPNQSVSRPDVAVSTAAQQLQSVAAPVNAVLASGPAGTLVTSSEVSPTSGIGGVLEAEAAKVGARVAAQPPQAAPMTAADIVKSVAGKPAAPTKAPAPGAAAAPPRIVRTENTGAEAAAKPAEPPPMVNVGQTDTTTSTGGVERSSTNRRETERAVGMSPAAATRIFNAMRNQGVINANQADALATGKMQLADLNDEQARIYNAAANDAAIRQRIVEDQTVERYTRAEEYQRQASEMRVDPKRMWKNASTGEKIQLGIAAMLGAFGSALQGKQDNAGVKIIEDAIKRDVDLQMQDIAAKREFANDTTRMAKLLMEQGNNSKETADYIKNLQILSATERAKGISQRAGNWRAEDLDPATGMPRPGTRSYEANRALIDAELKARQFVGNWEAERAGRERVTAEDAVKRATQTQRSVQTQQAAAAPAGGELAGRGVFSILNQEGKPEYYAVMNQEGMDAKEAVKQSQAVDKARGDLKEIDRLVANIGTRKITNEELKSVLRRSNAAIAVMNGQGAMTDAEAKAAEAGFLSMVEAKDVAASLRGYIDRASASIVRQTLGRKLSREEADKVAASQKPSGVKKLWPNRSSHRPSASTMRAARRWTRRPTTPSSCCGRSAATAWQRATPSRCVSLASAKCAWSRPTKPCAASWPASMTLRHSRFSASSSARKSSPASHRPSLALRRASRRWPSAGLAMPRSSAPLAWWGSRKRQGGTCKASRSSSRWPGPPARQSALQPRWWPRFSPVAARARQRWPLEVRRLYRAR